MSVQCVTRHWLCAATAIALATLACQSGTTGPTTVDVPGDNVSRTVRLAPGSELRVVLGNVGPGTFEAPPMVSSPILRFLGDSVIPPYTPAGPTQQFRFVALGPGIAILHFRRVLENSVIAVVEDTVEVR